jgi:hypothetical protein
MHQEKEIHARHYSHFLLFHIQKGILATGLSRPWIDKLHGAWMHIAPRRTSDRDAPQVIPLYAIV